MSSTDPDDPIADALLGDSTYERLRVQRYALIKQRIPRKLRWQGGLLLMLALIVPITATYPASVQAVFPSDDPLWSSPLVLWLGVYAGVIQLATAATLTAVAVVRRRGDATFSESQVRTLLNVEDVASMFGLVTGGFAVLLTVAFFLFGHMGAETVAEFVTAAPQNPYGQTAVSVPVIVVGTAAAIGAGLVYLTGRVLTLDSP
ncbi:hypothetical protein OB905_11070 [Halobacteria archaeon AArc-dxtr1]|nr:hypothetical protein [Halobacteria archaeon AArc-dxtr1]